MAEDFDYVSFWESARDVLDVLEALGNAKLPLLSLSGSWAVPGFPPAFNEGKRPKPPNYSERYGKAIDAIRKAGAALVSLLAETRFVLPLHGVWPPSAPRELTGKFSLALGIARTAFNETDPSKSSPESAQYTVRAVVAELERRWPDLAERAYQRARKKLQRPSAIVVVSDQAVTPAAQATVAAAPHEVTAAGDPDGIVAARWYHDPSEPKPPEYKHGPLIGTKKEIGRWLGEKDTPTPRRLEQKAKTYIVYVYRNGETTWEAWFKDEKTWEQARIKRDFG